MAVKPIIALPKGNLGMTLLGSSNDDSTVSLPDIGFDFIYNGNPTRIIYSSGNTWIGFGAAAEHLSINRKDTSYNKLYYALELANQTKTFRIRFEGNSYYSSWNSNDLIWEIELYETGVITIVIEKMPNNGPNNFINPGVGTQGLILATGKSYVLVPGSSDGKNYSFVEGSYFPHMEKFLIVDNEEIKSYQTIDEISAWIKVADLPITEELLLDFGIDALPSNLEGLVDNSPLVYYYTDNIDVIENTGSFNIQLSARATSLPKVIELKEDFLIHEDKIISNIVLDISTDSRDSSGNAISTNGNVKLAISIDEGVTWLTFNLDTRVFEEIDINNLTEFASNGIGPQNLSTIDYTELNNSILISRKIRFAYILLKPTFSDECKLRKIKIFYS